jgi:hypothetical protein
LALNVGPTETGAAAHWSLPRRHPYEDWSDGRAFDGTATILQPQAQPLYDAISPHTLLSLLMEHDVATSLETVRQTWRPIFSRFDDQWHDALASGVIAKTA